MTLTSDEERAYRKVCYACMHTRHEDEEFLKQKEVRF